MNRNELRNAVILNRLIHEMRNRGNWTAETNLQKAVFVLQEVFGLSLGLEFILYKHGPFSFDLQDQLTVQLAYNLVELEVHSGYGPRYKPTTLGDQQLTRFPVTLKNSEAVIQKTADTVGRRGIVELERLATAIWVIKNSPDLDKTKMARKINQLKPHIPVETAESSIEEAQSILAQAA